MSLFEVQKARKVFDQAFDFIGNCSKPIFTLLPTKLNYVHLFYFASVPAALLAAEQAKAADFRFSYGPNTTYEQMIGFEMAGAIWSAYLTDDVTLNIYVETTSTLPDGVVGGALPGMEPEYDYKDLLEAFRLDTTSQADTSAYSHLLPEDDLRFAYKGNNRDSDFIDKVKDVNLTRANAKALSIIDTSKEEKEEAKAKAKYEKEYAKYEACQQKNKKDCKNEKKKSDEAYDKYRKSRELDGVILMSDLSNTPLSWNYDPTASVASDQLDFLTVALHELGHNLGFVSGVDDPVFISVVTEQLVEGKEIKGDKVKFSTALDLFRYSASSTAEGIPDLTFSTEEKYFSIDGGLTNLGNFSLGNGLGDFQASHWQEQANSLGIMSPLLAPGERDQISALDKLFFDVIGWELAGTSSTPNFWLLEQQAKENIARSLGVSVEFLAANPDLTASLQEDWDKEIEKMIEESERYDRRRSRNGRYRFSQESWRSLYTQAYLSTTALPDESPASVPEPGTTGGLLGLAMLGLGAILRKSKK